MLFVDKPCLCRWSLLVGAAPPPFSTILLFHSAAMQVPVHRLQSHGVSQTTSWWCDQGTTGDPQPAEAAAETQRSNPSAFQIAKETCVHVPDPASAGTTPNLALWVLRWRVWACLMAASSSLWPRNTGSSESIQSQIPSDRATGQRSSQNSLMLPSLKVNLDKMLMLPLSAQQNSAQVPPHSWSHLCPCLATGTSHPTLQRKLYIAQVTSGGRGYRTLPAGLIFLYCKQLKIHWTTTGA